MQAQPSATQRPPLFVGRRETCRLLNISIHTLEKMLASGEIPSRRLRSKLAIPLQFLETLAKVGEEE